MTDAVQIFAPGDRLTDASGVVVPLGTIEVYTAGTTTPLTVYSDAALSVAIGASAAGARTYTATSSQGLLFMAEAVYNASGLGLPIVMTVANRAIGAPINIWNDHSDSMSQRDCGWIQLFAESNQEALDLHIQAFKLLGMNPSPMPIAELYTALESGTFDAQEHPINVTWSSKFYEVQKHLTISNSTRVISRN